MKNNKKNHYKVISQDVPSISSCLALLASFQSDTSDDIYKIKKEISDLKEMNEDLSKRVDRIEQNSE